MILASEELISFLSPLFELLFPFVEDVDCLFGLLEVDPQFGDVVLEVGLFQALVQRLRGHVGAAWDQVNGRVA